jgi:hypothetical protein
MLLRRIEIFLRETDMAWTKFGRLATHDPRFVADLRNGRSPRPDTEARVDGFIAGYRAALPLETRHAG